MPVYRRRKASRKRNYKRRNWLPRKKYATRRNFTKPDGYHTEKIVYDLRMVTNSENVAEIGVSWVRTSSGWQELNNDPANFPWIHVAGSNNPNKQFEQCASMYKEYMVKGFKVIYSPTLSLGIESGQIVRLHSGTLMQNPTNTTHCPSEDMQGSIDYKQYNPARGFKRYYHVTRWSKQHLDNVWQSTEKALNNSYAIIPDNVTGVRMETIGVPSGY